MKKGAARDEPPRLRKSRNVWKNRPVLRPSLAAWRMWWEGRKAHSPISGQSGLQKSAIAHPMHARNVDRKQPMKGWHHPNPVHAGDCNGRANAQACPGQGCKTTNGRRVAASAAACRRWRPGWLKDIPLSQEENQDHKWRVSASGDDTGHSSSGSAMDKRTVSSGVIYAQKPLFESIEPRWPAGSDSPPGTTPTGVPRPQAEGKRCPAQPLWFDRAAQMCVAWVHSWRPGGR